MDAAAMDVAATDIAAIGAATDAMDTPTVLMDSEAIYSAAAMDAVDVVVGTLPLSPKNVIKLEATTYPPTKTLSATQAIDTTININAASTRAASAAGISSPSAGGAAGISSPSITDPLEGD